MVMDGLRSSLMAENVAGRHPMDVLNGVCAPCIRSFAIQDELTVHLYIACIRGSYLHPQWRRGC